MTPITLQQHLGKEDIIWHCLKFAKPLSVLSVFGRFVGGPWIKLLEKFSLYSFPK